MEEEKEGNTSPLLNKEGAVNIVYVLDHFVVVVLCTRGCLDVHHE
jgi:hypothetical protein